MTKPKVAPLLPGNVQISPSQLNSFESCERQWWFSYVIKMPAVKKDYFAFGTVLHGCIERWLAADALSRVPSPVPAALEGQTPGAAVNLYPEGWATVAEKGKTQEMTPKECAVIRKLMLQAIERGIIDRHNLVGVELCIQVQVIDGVELIGYVDIVKLEGIHDHKSFGKSSVPYLKRSGPKTEAGEPIIIEAPHQEGDGTSPNCVGHDPQLLTYAYVIFTEGNSEPDPVLVRHNQFPKDPSDTKGPRAVEAWVSPARLEAHWETVKAAAARMQVLRPITNEMDWATVPGPLESAKHDAQACSAFGGCAFRLICAKQELPGQHRLRVNTHLGIAPTQPQPQTQSQIPMSLFKTYTGATAAAATPPPQAPIVPVNGAAPAASAPARPDYTGVPVAPWANPECRTCAGTGQNLEKGRPCTPCEALAARANRPTTDLFTITADARGWLSWAPKTLAPTPASSALAPAGAPRPSKLSLPGRKAAQAPAPAVLPPAGASTTMLPVDPLPAPGAAQAAPAPCEAPAEAVAPTPAEPLNQGRKPLGIVLRLGCTILKGPAGRKTMTIQDVLAFVGGKLAENKGVPSYYHINAFERRDLIAAAAQEIADELQSVVVVGNISCPDTRALYGALVTVSKDVIEGAVN